MALHLLRHVRDSMPLGVLRFLINSWPPLLGAGIKIKSLSRDYRDIVVNLSLHWYNKNYVGTHFGGSIFAMTDPFYMLMLIKNLGDEYIVWDKAAQIDFKKPGTGVLTAHFVMTEEILQKARESTSQGAKYIFDLPIDIYNQENIIVATVIRTLYVRRKDAFTNQPAVTKET